MANQEDTQDKNNHTYWHHPESDSFYIMDHDPQGDQGDGMSHEITEAQYVRGLVSQIESSPDKQLPEGITAVIKLAAFLGSPKQYINGAIWFDKGDRFINGFLINTTQIKQKLPGGIYVTQSGRKYLVDFADPNDYEVAVNG